MVQKEEYTERTAIKKAFSNEIDEHEVQDIPRPWHQKLPKRYILAIMAFLGFCNIYALRVNLSVAIVAMTNNITVIFNGTEIQEQEFQWSSHTQGLVLGAFFYGYIVTQIPGGWLANIMGGKLLFGCGVLGTALLTVLTPPAARISPYCLVALRVIEGLFEGVTYPTMHAMWSRWAPPLERSKLATIAFSGSYLGTVIALPISGALAHHVGWPSVFYLFGFLGILWFAGWVYFTAESPEDHTTISQDELEHIQSSIGFTCNASSFDLPWRSICKSLPVWAIIVAHFSANWGFYTLLTELPTFFNDVIRYDMNQTGIAAALPYLAMTIVVVVGGYLADFLREQQFISTTMTRKIFTSGAFIGQAVFTFLTAFTASAGAAVACLTLSVGIGGFTWAGFSVNHLDIAPQYAGILMGVTNTFATIPGIISPSITGAITEDKTAAEWRIVFFIISAIYIAGAVFYGVFASGDVQVWAELSSSYQVHSDEQPLEEEEEQQPEITQVH